MAFFDTITSIVNPKNLLTAGGAMIGGPLGAGLGRAGGELVFGDDFVPFNYGDDPTNLANVVGEGAMGGGTALAGQSALSAIRGMPETAAAGAGTQAAAGGGVSGSAPGMDFSVIPPEANVVPPSASGAMDQPVVIGDVGGPSVPEAGGSQGGAGMGMTPGGALPFQRQMMGLAGASALGRMGSGLMEGAMEERRRERLEKLAKLLQPKFKETLEGLDF